MQMITWYDYLFYFSIAGLVILAAGAVLSAVWRKEQKKRHIGWYIAGAGAFLALASFLIWKLNTPALTFLSVLVPVVMLLGILWNLYDRECALALTILGTSLIVLWVCRRVMSSIYLGTYVKVVVILYLVLLIATAFLAKNDKLRKLLPANADLLPVYLACGLSFVALVVALINTVAAYYAMWALAIVVFALAVYYTVKQL